ncbi:MAG TPA: alpha/beta hydrolase [Steroidobacteraceae bacterium]|nr:alpha/beta hydrolase [Steroidobacteraceae bacterium]
MRTSTRWAIGIVTGLCLQVPLLGAAEPNPLPRKGEFKDESYPGVAVIYDALRDAAGQRLRLILTHPQSGGPRFATIFVAGWLSCDTVEAPADTNDAAAKVFRYLAQLPEFATVRLEKAGVGDSEGDCAASDFDRELSAYRQAFRHLQDYPFVDGSRIFILGVSNGGGFAPLVADGLPVKGYVVNGGWIKTWFEHMLEIERRRLTLSDHPPSEINPLMQSVEKLYSAYLLERRPPQEIFAQHPELKSLWDGDPGQLYGRPVVYYQQLQDLNLMGAWSKVSVPVLALHGEYDWIMSRGDFEILVTLVNHNRPGAAEFVELPSSGHTFQHYASQAAAFKGPELPFDASIARRIGEWFAQHRN